MADEQTVTGGDVDDLVADSAPMPGALLTAFAGDLNGRLRARLENDTDFDPKRYPNAAAQMKKE